MFFDQMGIFFFLYFNLIFCLYEESSLWYIADSHLKIQNIIVIDESHGYRMEADMKGKKNDRKQSK